MLAGYWCRRTKKGPEPKYGKFKSMPKYDKYRTKQGSKSGPNKENLGKDRCEDYMMEESFVMKVMQVCRVAKQ
jgi:hypothetical protein